jgi:hypothetical protein
MLKSWNKERSGKKKQRTNYQMNIFYIYLVVHALACTKICLLNLEVNLCALGAPEGLDEKLSVGRNYSVLSRATFTHSLPDDLRCDANAPSWH